MPNNKSGRIPTMLNNALLDRKALFQWAREGLKTNLDEELGYPVEITPKMYRDMYDREGVARRVVSCMPEESWCVQPDVFETEGSDESDFESKWGELQEKIGIWHYLHRIDELSGIGRFGVLMLGLNDGKLLSEPVDGIDAKGEGRRNKETELLYLRCFDESVAEVKTRETDTSNPRYGRPTIYQIKFQDAKTQTGTMTEESSQDVHWTRVIHIADNRSMSEVFGTPRMQAVFNRLLDIRKVLGGSAQMYWNGAFPGFSFEVQPDLLQTGASIDADALKDEVEKYFGGLQRYFALEGMTAKPLSANVPDPSQHVEQHLKAIAISMSIPYRILFGSEVAKLASAQDARTWHQRITRRQNTYLTPMIVSPFVQRLVQVGVLPEPKEMHVEWPDLGAATDEEQARLAGVKTEAMAKYVAGGVEQLMSPRQWFMRVLGMSPDEIDEIEEEQKAAIAEEEALGAVEEVEEDEVEGPVDNVDDQPRDEHGRFAPVDGGSTREREIGKWHDSPPLDEAMVETADAYGANPGEGAFDSLVTEMGADADMQHYRRNLREWTQGADPEAKSNIVGILEMNPAARTASLYHDYVGQESEQPFSEWLETPQDYYRGGGDSPDFMSFTPSARAARDASGEGESAVLQHIKMAPKDLLGSGMTGAGEVFISSDALM